MPSSPPTSTVHIYLKNPKLKQKSPPTPQADRMRPTSKLNVYLNCIYMYVYVYAYVCVSREPGCVLHQRIHTHTLTHTHWRGGRERDPLLSCLPARACSTQTHKHKQARKARERPSFLLPPRVSMQYIENFCSSSSISTRCWTLPLFFLFLFTRSSTSAAALPTVPGLGRCPFSVSFSPYTLPPFFFTLHPAPRILHQLFHKHPVLDAILFPFPKKKGGGRGWVSLRRYLFPFPFPPFSFHPTPCTLEFSSSSSTSTRS
jgi:hypothetical protein